MAVELILIEDVDGLGRIGEEVRVAEGYARNYLMPKKLAVAVTKGNLRQLEAKKLRLQKECENRLEVAQTMAKTIGAMSVTLSVEADENDKLYGSVSPVQILQALAEESVEIPKGAVQMDEPIRELGTYSVDIKLHEDVQTTLKVWVVRK